MYDTVLLLKRNMMSYFKEEIKMVQQISDAEFEIMKVVWANGEKPTLFASLTADLAAKGKPWQKNTLITLLNRLVNKGFLKAKKSDAAMNTRLLCRKANTTKPRPKIFWIKFMREMQNGLFPI